MNKLNFLKNGSGAKIESNDYKESLKTWLWANRNLTENQIIDNKFTNPPAKFIGESVNLDMAKLLLIKQIKDAYLKDKIYSSLIYIVPSLLGIIGSFVISHFIHCSIPATILMCLVLGWSGIYIYLARGGSPDWLQMTTLVFSLVSFVTGMVFFMATWRVNNIEVPYEYVKAKNSVIIIYNDKAYYHQSTKFFNFDSSKQKIILCKPMSLFNTRASDPDYFDIEDKK